MRDPGSQSELDREVRSRLARLASIPVDTSRLQRQLQSALSPDLLQTQRRRWSHPWRSLTAAAAAILIVATTAIILVNAGNSPAMASPSDLARLHAQTLLQESMATTVTSLEQANRVLAGQWSDLPQIPAPESAKLHSCCIHDFMDSKIACIILRDGQTPLTMVVGHARQFRPAKGNVVQRGGRSFTLHQVNGLRMAMTQQGGRFVCLMGEVSEERLLSIAENLKF